MPQIRPVRPPDPTVLRLRTPGEVVEGVPYLLGFHPVASLVAIALQPSNSKRHRLGLHLRVDLPEPEAADALAAVVADRLCKDGATAALLIAYLPTADQSAAGARPAEPAADGPDPRAAAQGVISAVCEELAGRGVSVRDALCVARGRWWSYRCSQPSCCPSTGTPIRTAASGTSRLAAAATYAGLVARPDRDSMAAETAPRGGPAGARMRQALAEARAQAEHARAGGATATRRWRRESVALLHEVRDRYGASGGQPEASATSPGGTGEGGMSDAEAARLLLALPDLAVRDETGAWLDGVREQGGLELFRELSRRAAESDVVPAVSTLLGLFAYRCGDGALANVAFDRALAADPGYRFARLLQHALHAGMHPSELSALRPPPRRARKSSGGGAVAALRTQQ